MHVVFALSMSTILDAHSMNPAGSEVTDDTIKRFRTGMAAEKERLTSLLSNAVFTEWLASSRVPNPNEISAVDSLTIMFGQGGIQIDEVRYMGAASLIGAMRLPDDTKQHHLSLLEAPAEEAINSVMTFFSSCQFPPDDEPFKTRILGDIHGICTKSKVGRSLLVTLIARVLSEPSISTKIVRDVTGHSFSFQKQQSTKPSGSTYNSISMNYESNACWSSFFNYPSAVAEVRPGVFAYSDNDPSVLSYAFGHSTSSDLLKGASILGMDRTMELMYPVTIGALDELALFAHFDNAKTAPQPIQRHLVRDLIVPISTHITDRNIDGAEEKLRLHLSSQEDLTRYLFVDAVIIFQMIGLALLSHNGSNTLFVNSLSNFALMLDLGMPIRCDSRGCCPDPTTAEDHYKFLYPQKPLVQHSMNTDFYEALMSVHGSSMEEYRSKLSASGI
jgi:hypothetical protein